MPDESGGAPVLEVRDLRVGAMTPAGEVPLVRDVSYDLRPGRTLAIVGESGSGKTTSVLALLRLFPLRSDYRVSGTAKFRGTDLLSLSDAALRRFRGGALAMVFQDPGTSLDPVRTVGAQIAEMAARHLALGRRPSRERAIELLNLVGVPNPRRAVDRFPHQLSGGMRQRAMIATALAGHPAVLIADEPTSSLDVTIQAQVLGLLKRTSEAMGLATILITHDVGIVAALADDVAVLYAGRIVERGTRDEILGSPDHPYTQALLASIPRLDSPRGTRLGSIPGIPPELHDAQAGCAFEPRCHHRIERCALERPPLEPLDDARGRVSACWVHPSLAAAGSR